jgi:broad specificity phosphatase PhoE
MYLIRHAAAEAIHAPDEAAARARANPPLTRLGLRQAELTRDFLGIRPIDYCYSSPLVRAMQTASIIAAPHGLIPQPLPGLAEPAQLADTLEELFGRHAGHALLVVGHHEVGRIYLAGVLGLEARQAEHVHLDNCGISVVVRTGAATAVTTLNASFHLQGIAA